MWLGLGIALIFLATGVMVTVAGVMTIVRKRNWAVGVTLIVPAVAFLYFFGTFAGPTLRIEIFGDPSVAVVSSDAQKVPAGDLQALYEGRIHDGKYYDSSSNKWSHYKETYLASGAIRGKSGPEGNPERWSYSGEWKIENGLICQKYDGDFDCSDVYQTGDTYSYIDENEQIVSWFTISEPAGGLDPAAARLTGDELSEVIDGKTHAGLLTGSDNAASFQAKFFAGNHAVYTRRGDRPDQLDQTEYGWYRFDGDKVCLSGTLGTRRDCFAVYLLDGTFSFVPEGDQVDMTTNLAM